MNIHAKTETMSKIILKRHYLNKRLRSKNRKLYNSFQQIKIETLYVLKIIYQIKKKVTK